MQEFARGQAVSFDDELSHYDDPLNELGDSEEEVNDYYIENTGAVRGAVLKDGSHAYLEGRTLRLVQTCLVDLLRDYPGLSSATIEVGSLNQDLAGEAFEFFVKRGRIPRPR